MLASHVAYFKAHRQPVAAASRRTTANQASAALPIAQAVRDGLFGKPARVASAVSQPHPERKSVLIDANALLLADIVAGARFTIPIPHCALHVRRQELELDRIAHRRPVVVRRFGPLRELARDAAAGADADPGAEPVPRRSERCPTPAACSSASTTTSRRCPSRCKARRADPRVGISTRRSGTSRPIRATRRDPPRQIGWRLEKKDPAAGAVGTGAADRVLDRQGRASNTAPRCATHCGVEQDLRAHRVQGRIVVRQQAADADFDTADARHATVRCTRRPTAASRSAPATSTRDRRDLDADVAIPDSWSRLNRNFISRRRRPPAPPTHAHDARTAADARHVHLCRRCAGRGGVPRSTS